MYLFRYLVLLQSTSSVNQGMLDPHYIDQVFFGGPLPFISRLNYLVFPYEILVKPPKV